MTEQFTTTVNVSGSGDSKARAFADALSRVQNTLLKSTDKVLLRIEPQDVKVIKASESISQETFLFFFLVRTRRRYCIELDITVNVSVIDVNAVDFATQ